MVRADAKVDGVCLLDSEAVRLRIVIDQLGDSVRLSDRNNGGLWTKNGRYKVPSTDVTDAGNTEGPIVEVCLGKTAVRGLIRQIFQVTIDLKNALGLDGLDVWNSQAIWTVDGDTEVVVMLDHVLLNVAFAIQLVVDV